MDVPEVTHQQLALIERANSNVAAMCEVVAPMIGLDWFTLWKAINIHGARKVLIAARLLKG